MSCLQASIVKNYPCIRKHQDSSESGSHSRQCRVAIQTLQSFASSSSLQLSAKEVMCHQTSKLPVHKYRRLVPVGSFGGQAKSSDGEGLGQKSPEAAIGRFRKEPSLEDLLRKQMEKQGYFNGDDGDDTGGKPPRGGGGGGGSGGGGGKSPEGGGSNEVVQVFLATSALLMLYIYMINGEDLLKLARDYMIYLRNGNQSNRLQRAMVKWRMLSKSATKEPEDPSAGLEKDIFLASTWSDKRKRKGRAVSSEFSIEDEGLEAAPEDLADFNYMPDDNDEDEDDENNDDDEEARR